MTPEQVKQIVEQALRDWRNFPWQTWVLTLVILGIVAFIGSYVAESAKQRAILEALEENTKIVEGIKSSHDKASHVSKTQFDTEFRIYKEVWTQLVTLRNAALALRPPLEMIDPKEGEAERKRRKIDEIYKYRRAVLSTIENYKPFYVAEIRKELDAFADLAWVELVQYRIGDPGRDFERYWNDAEKNQKEIMASTDKICEAIRQRVESLAKAL